MNAWNGLPIPIIPFPSRAMWERSAEIVQAPYLERLQAHYLALTAGEYAGEDLERLSQLFADAKERVIAAGRDETALEQIASDAEREMSAVPVWNARTAEIADKWREEFREPLSCLGVYPIPSGRAETLFPLAESALENSLPEKLAAYSSLTRPADALRAAEAAEALLREEREELRLFLPAAQWTAEAEKAVIPPAQADSSMREKYERLLGALGEAEEGTKRYLSDETIALLGGLLRLTQAKEEAVETIRAQFAQYRQEEYSEENWQALSAIADQYLQQAEGAESEDAVGLAVTKGLLEMGNVPKTGETPEPEPEPEPEPDPEPEPEPEPEKPGENEKPPASFWGKYGRIIVAVAAGAVVIAAAAVLIVFLKRRR